MVRKVTIAFFLINFYFLHNVIHICRESDWLTDCMVFYTVFQQYFSYIAAASAPTQAFVESFYQCSQALGCFPT